MSPTYAGASSILSQATIQLISLVSIGFYTLKVFPGSEKSVLSISHPDFLLKALALILQAAWIYTEFDLGSAFLPLLPGTLSVDSIVETTIESKQIFLYH